LLTAVTFVVQYIDAKLRMGVALTSHRRLAPKFKKES
jgi:hypothetical protein